jgi:hypothetical protein
MPSARGAGSSCACLCFSAAAPTLFSPSRAAAAAAAAAAAVGSPTAQQDSPRQRPHPAAPAAHLLLHARQRRASPQVRQPGALEGDLVRLVVRHAVGAPAAALHLRRRTASRNRQSAQRRPPSGRRLQLCRRTAVPKGCRGCACSGSSARDESGCAGNPPPPPRLGRQPRAVRGGGGRSGGREWRQGALLTSPAGSSVGAAAAACRERSPMAASAAVSSPSSCSCRMPRSISITSAALACMLRGGGRGRGQGADGCSAGRGGWPQRELRMLGGLCDVARGRRGAAVWQVRPVSRLGPALWGPARRPGGHWALAGGRRSSGVLTRR